MRNQIVSRLRAAVPAAVRPMGSEDAEELLQDGMVLAAQLLHAAEARGKEVTAGNIAYYTTLLLRSGRRSQSAGRTDVLGAATMVDGKSLALSLEEPVGSCPESGEVVALGEMLAGSHEDPSSAAARNIDWGEFLPAATTATPPWCGARRQSDVESEQERKVGSAFLYHAACRTEVCQAG